MIKLRLQITETNELIPNRVIIYLHTGGWGGSLEIATGSYRDDAIRSAQKHLQDLIEDLDRLTGR